MLEIKDLNTKPKTEAEMTASLEKVRDQLVSLSELGGTNEAALKTAAADLQTMKASLETAMQEAVKAKEIAAAAGRTVPSPSSVSDEDLRAIPQPYDVDKEFEGKLSRSHYNLMMLPKRAVEQLPENVGRLIAAFREQHDACSILHAFNLGRGNERAFAYAQAGGMESLRCYQTFKATAKRLQAAMDTAEAAKGGAWVPTGVGTSLIEDIRPSLELVGYIPSIPMPRSPYQYPVQGVHFKTYKTGEATADSGNTAIGKRDLQTLKLIFTAVKHAAMMLTSTELDEDSIVPIIPGIRADFLFAVAAGLEDAWLNGQIVEAGFPGVFDTGSVPAGTDVRDSWNGLRAAAEATTLTVDAAAGLLVEHLTGLKGKLGKFGKSPTEGVWDTGYIGWAKLLTLKDSSGTSVLLTQDKMGAGATLPSGTLGMVLGSPLVVSDDYPENQNAAGVIDGAGDKTGLLYFNRRCFRHGEVRLSLIEASRDWAFDVDQLAFRVTYRSSGRPVRPPTSTDWRAAGKITGIPTV